MSELTWDGAARASLSPGQIRMAGAIAEATGGPTGYRLEDGNVIAVPGVTREALDAALAKYPAADCDRKETERRARIVKLEAARRIRESGLPWMVEREVSSGKPVPQEVKDYCAGRLGFVRAAAMRR